MSGVAEVSVNERHVCRVGDALVSDDDADDADVI